MNPSRSTNSGRDFIKHTTMHDFTEYVGYAASALVLLSFLMKKMTTLRLVNSLGCVGFIIYGILLHYSWPIIITNVAICLVNAYYLFGTKLKNLKG